MQDQFYILGEFEGSFYTHQKGTLGAFEKAPKDQSHALRVYEGKIINPEFLPEYKPEEFRNYDSYLLANADNIEVHPSENAPIKSPDIFNFTQVVLVNPIFDKFWESNNKTYGRVRGKLYGITEKPRNDNNEDNNGTNNPPPVIPPPPPIREQNLQNNRGCLNFLLNYSWPPLLGCISNFWRILGWLLMLFLLFSMIKACNEYSRIKDYCYENELIKERIKEKRKITDSLEQEFLKKKKNKLKYFSSIYFYGNTAKIRDISERDMISVIDFVKQYSDSKYEIAGYSNGVSNDNVDVKRANVVKKRLIEAGIDSTILKVVGYGNKNMKVDSDDLREDNFGSYNANMRVEIKLLDK